MKKETTHGFKKLETPEIKNLCNETKETPLTKTQVKKFSVVDLWAIQKGRKPASLRSAMAI
jgi:hypothetical protein